MDANKLYVPQDIPGKGRGLVAAKNIPQGTCILAEEPILKLLNLRLPIEKVIENLTQQLEEMNDADRSIFLSLANSFPDLASKELGIACTNALLMSDDVPNLIGIFPIAARFNHACLQNAQNMWQEDTEELAAHAIRDIAEGEEITISYLHYWMPRAKRQSYLRQDYRFECTCQLCSLPDAESKLIDTKLKKLDLIDTLINQKDYLLPRPLRALRDVHRMLKLCEEVGITNLTLARVYEYASHIAVANGDQARSRIFAQRTVAISEILEGAGGAIGQVFREFAQDPTEFVDIRDDAIWATEVDDVPTGLSDGDFEAWLWRENAEDAIEVSQQCN